MNRFTEELADLTGLIDIHIHSAPDVVPRWGNDLAVVKEAKMAGMKAVLLKSHHTITADRANLVERVVGGIQVFGGLVLNDAVGGLNPEAVEIAAQLGAAEIWMPTKSSAHTTGPKGISIVNNQGKMKPEIHTILEIIRDRNMILATGHISPAESTLLIREAKSIGLTKIIITHPEAKFIDMSQKQQLELRGEGVYFERCFIDTTPVMDSLVSVEAIAENIRAVGIDSTILSTDYGVLTAGSPVQGMRDYLLELALLGFSETDLILMAGHNPSKILGIS